MDMIELNQTDQHLRRNLILNTVCNQLVEYLKPQKIYLFGSQAKEQASERSDIDVLVITEQALTSYQKRAISQVFVEMPITVDLVFYTEANLTAEAKREHSFAYSILRSALLLYSQLEDSSE